MPGYEIHHKAKHIEVHITQDLTPEFFTEVLGKVARIKDFQYENTMWLFARDIKPLSLSDFGWILNTIRMLYPDHPVDKKSALVANDNLVKIATQAFEQAAASLPYTLRAFSKYEDALAWLNA